jgi:feruloyl esterase
MRRGRIALAGMAGAALLLGAAPARAQDCAALGQLALPTASIGVAEPVAAGEYRPAGAAAALTGLPAFCRVEGVIQPVPGSRIGFQLWLPQSGWNGRLLMVGNGGYSSAMAFPEMATRLRQGWATVATDTGHTGDDPDFAAGRPESIVDWGHRAVHETATRAKSVVERFYGSAARRSYFAGCSTGGHQAFAEAQRYPEDFDGILAGAPGHNRTHLNAAFLWQYLRNHETGNDAAQVIPASKLPMISRAVHAACRANNGTVSGGLPGDAFLNNPLDCQFDPAVLQCRGGDGEDCLTTPQVEALRAMYDGARNPRTGQRIAFGFPRGSENSGRVIPSLPGWSLYWADPRNPNQPARVNFWRIWAFGDPGWNWWSFDFDRDMARVDDRLAPVVNAMDPDLERFRARGGRLLQ